MRIISKNRDYYDSAMAYGSEPFVFNRETVMIDSPVSIDKYYSDQFEVGKWNTRMIRPESSTELLQNEAFTVGYGVIGFCGKMYSFLSAQNKQDVYYFYDIESVDKFMESGIPSKKVVSEYYHEDKKTEWYMEHSLLRDNWVKYFNAYPVSECSDIFADMNTPYFVNYIEPSSRVWSHRNRKTVSLPILKDFGLQKIIDPFTAFQEISMFISGVLGVGEGEIVKIADIHLRDSKGFDDWSFKKKSKKKK